MADDADIKPDSPLRLAEAVDRAFPAGGMTVSGLRREIARGRLQFEMIAGKQFVTLAAIEEMRRLCQQRRGPLSVPLGLERKATDSDSDRVALARDALVAKAIAMTREKPRR